MALINGIDAYFYQGASGSTPSTLLANVRDATVNYGTIEADVTVKQSGFTLTDVVRHDVSVEFEILEDPTDTGFQAIETAYQTKAAIAILILNGPKATAGSKGIDADWKVTNFSQPQPNDGKLTRTVTIKPAKTARAPAFYTST